MPRRPRLQIAGFPFHVIQRGNNRTACFFADQDYRFFLEHLGQLSRKHAVEVHAYVLMTNHTHLLVTPRAPGTLGLLMKKLGQRYVQYVNKTYRRSGSLWEGRFRSSLVVAEPYLFACQRYIELNPVRAGMVEHPADYPWSSYRCNGQGAVDSLITPHPLYCNLGARETRCAGYREMFRGELPMRLVNEIRKSTNSGYVLGSERFKAQIEATLGRRASRGVSGRPRLEVDLRTRELDLE